MLESRDDVAKFDYVEINKNIFLTSYISKGHVCRQTGLAIAIKFDSTMIMFDKCHTTHTQILMTINLYRGSDWIKYNTFR